MPSHRELLRSMRSSSGITVARAIELATEKLSADNAALKAQIARMRPVFRAAMRRWRQRQCTGNYHPDYNQVETQEDEVCARAARKAKEKR